MLVVFPNMASENVLIADVEFDQDNILQLAGMLFSKQVGDIYKLERSINLYVKRNNVGYYANKHTGITVDKLQKEGLEFQDFWKQANNFVLGIDLNKTVFVSHGTKGDRKILRDSGILLPAHSMCTYKLSQKKLKAENGYKLSDVAAQAGFTGGSYHDALVDVLATTASLSYLLSIKDESE